MMTCRELTQLVSDHLEGALSLSERLRFQLHLGLCRNCRAYLRQMRQTLRILGRLPSELPAAPARDELLARFRAWKAG
jgi:predicted anti-sigma-YlaC factor YlaD